MIIVGVFILLIFFFGLVSRRVERTVITGPIIFVAAGLLMPFVLPQLAEVDLQIKPVVLFSEIALALVLFTDASRIKLLSAIRGSDLPGRLLGIGMPLTILAGTVVAVLLFPKLLMWEAAILATILAPTDAGLGEVVFHSRLVPARIRQALTVESGLNDGISLPFLMLFIALARSEPDLGDFAWIGYTLQQIGFGVLIGLATGWLGGWLLQAAEKRGWMTKSFQQLGLLALALICWGGAEMLGGNGFISAFVGGMFVKLEFERAGEKMIEYSEAWGQLLSFGVFFLFGMLAAPDLGSFGATVLVYALLSLTLVRMLPVAISLAGTGLKPVSILFVGWFGPRGLASIVLGLIYLKQKAHLPGEELITLVIVAVVLLSVLAHGLSAIPGVKLYAARLENLDPGAPEFQESAGASSA